MPEITINQELPIHISPKDARGNVARVDGDPTWSVSDDSLVELVPGTDEFDKVVRPKGPIGAALITCTVDADLGEGVKNLVGQLTVTVLPGEASTLAINAGTPVATQPAPAPVVDPAPVTEQPAADPASTDTAATVDATGEATAEVTTDPAATEAVAVEGTVVAEGAVTEQPAADPAAAPATEAQAETAAEAVTEAQPEGGATTAG